MTNNGSGDIHVLHNQGDGSFVTAQVHVAPGPPWELILQDLSGDGILDMAAATSEAAQVFVWQGTGDGNFVTAGSLATGYGTLGLIAADLRLWCAGRTLRELNDTGGRKFFQEAEKYNGREREARPFGERRKWYGIRG